MTDIRTAAQAVIDTWDEYGVTACIVHIEALRHALAAPVEPVATWERNQIDQFIGFTIIGDPYVVSCAKLYTTPPSVDALIAAGTALYMAGRWSCDQPVNEAKLWENLRDALMLPMGTETERARGQK